MTRTTDKTSAAIGKRRAKALGRLLAAAEVHDDAWPEGKPYPLAERELYFLEDMRERLEQWAERLIVSERQARWLASIASRLRASGAEIPPDAWGLAPKPAPAKPVRPKRPDAPEAAARPLPAVLADLAARAETGDALSAALLRIAPEGGQG